MRRRHGLLQRAEDCPQAEALKVGEQILCFGELAELAKKMAWGLRAAEVRPGDLVAALLPNGLPLALLPHALPLCGARFLPLNPRLSPRELWQQLHDSSATHLIHDGEAPAVRLPAVRLPGTRSVGTRSVSWHPFGRDVRLPGTRSGRQRLPRQRLPGTRSGCTRGPGTGPPSRPIAMLTPRDLAGHDSGAEPLWEEVDLDDDFAVLFTSGTTGRAKGAVLTHGNLLWSAVASELRLGSPRGPDRWLACLPLFHVGGLSILARSALFGSAVIVHERFDPARVSRALDDEGVTLLSLVPTMLRRLLEARGDRPAPASLRALLLGGAAAPASLVRRARALGYPVLPTYGLTEAASQVATATPAQAERDPSAVGHPLFGTGLRIVGPDGRCLPPGDEGEILVRGPSVMRGYLGAPEASQAALRGGWLHTGDIGVLDSTGSLRVLDRRNDLVVSGGENVYPAEVEAALAEHPDVAEAGVSGLDDADLGRRVSAWVVLRPDRSPSALELRRFVRERIAGYKVPKDIHFVSELPRNTAGKLLRRQLPTSR